MSSILGKGGNIRKYKMIVLNKHSVTLTEDSDGILVVNISPINDNVFDTTKIIHEVDSGIVHISSSRKIGEVF